MEYKVVKELHTETKVAKTLFLKDLFALICYPAAMYFIAGGLVSGRVMLAYLVFNLAVVLVLLQRPHKNPGKQVWQVLLFLLKEDTETYHMILPGKDAKGGSSDGLVS